MERPSMCLRQIPSILCVYMKSSESEMVGKPGEAQVSSGDEQAITFSAASPCSCCLYPLALRRMADTGPNVEERLSGSGFGLQ